MKFQLGQSYNFRSQEGSRKMKFQPEQYVAIPVYAKHSSRHVANCSIKQFKTFLLAVVNT